MARVEFKGVSHSYREDDSIVRGELTDKPDAWALSDVDLAVEDGESIAIIGPSGCGKSSMLLMADGLLRPTRGSVLIDGAESLEPRTQTALMLQNLGLFPWKTVFANVELGLLLRHVGKGERVERTMRALEGVGLADDAGKYPAELSGGMRQRVAIARALALDCDLLLMDEPLSALDELLREQIQDMLLDLWRQRRHTQIIVTHSIEEGVYLGQRIVVLTPHPGSVALVVDNPGMGERAWRNDPDFFAACQRVRAALAHSHVGHGTAKDATGELASGIDVPAPMGRGL